MRLHEVTASGTYFSIHILLRFSAISFRSCGCIFNGLTSEHPRKFKELSGRLLCVSFFFFFFFFFFFSSSSSSSFSSIGTTAHCELWPVEQCPIFSYLPPTLSIFSLPALEDLFLLPLSISSLPILE